MNKDTHPLEDEHKFPACISKIMNLYNIFKLSPFEDINCSEFRKYEDNEIQDAPLNYTFVKLRKTGAG